MSRSLLTAMVLLALWPSCCLRVALSQPSAEHLLDKVWPYCAGPELGDLLYVGKDGALLSRLLTATPWGINSVTTKAAADAKLPEGTPVHSDLRRGLFDTIIAGEGDALARPRHFAALSSMLRPGGLFVFLTTRDLTTGSKDPAAALFAERYDLTFANAIAHCATKINLARRSEPLTFHLCWTTPADRFRPWRLSVVASIFKHHPDAHVQVHTNTLGTSWFMPFYEAGRRLSIVPLTPDIFKGSHLEPFRIRVAKAMGQVELGQPTEFDPFFYSHLTDSLRLILLWRYGGVYLDFDVIVMRPMTNIRNAVGLQDERFVNCAVAKFNRGHPILGWMATRLPVVWNPGYWTSIGPGLWSSAIDQWGEDRAISRLPRLNSTAEPSGRMVNVYGVEVFYPVGWQEIADGRWWNASMYQPADYTRLVASSVTFHVWTKVFSAHVVEPGSLLYRIFNDTGRPATLSDFASP